VEIKHEITPGSEKVHIWFGPLTDPPYRPSGYANASASLDPAAAAVGAVHDFTWQPGNLTHVQQVVLAPSTFADRGASGVIGLRLGDILPDQVHVGDELVVGTLSGDIFILDPTSLVELWRTHVIGAAGMPNAIRIADLDAQVPGNELYVAGSWGLWRFIPQ